MAGEFSMVRVGRIPPSPGEEQGFFAGGGEFFCLRFAEQGGKGAEARR